jgi:hypothetical protein
VSKIPDYPRIWLQPFQSDDGGHTWCSERVENEDIEYVRLDAHEAAVEQAFKDGVEYATIVAVPNTAEDREHAWSISRARAAIRRLGEPHEAARAGK